MCLCSRTRFRRLSVRLAVVLFPRKPRTPAGRLALLAAARRLASLADWVHVRCDDVIAELEEFS